MTGPTRGRITNDAVWHDTDGEEIWANGGAIARFDGTFYWVGYETAPGAYPDGWRVRVYASENLSDWRYIGCAFESVGEFTRFDWAGRPALARAEETDEYVVVFEADSDEWDRHKVGYASADSPAGPYSLDRVAYPEPDQSTGDQSVFRWNGDAYLVAVLDGELGVQREYNQRIGVFRLRPDCRGVAEKVYDGFERETPEDAVEAPHIFERNGRFYLFASGCAWWQSTPTQYSTAPALSGPWSPLEPVQCHLDHGDGPVPRRLNSFNTQHDFVVPVEGSETTTFVYAGDRYTQYHGYGVGRNVFLPLTWDGDTPQLHWQDDWWIDVETGEWGPE